MAVLLQKSVKLNSKLGSKYVRKKSIIRKLFGTYFSCYREITEGYQYEKLNLFVFSVFFSGKIQ